MRSWACRGLAWDSVGDSFVYCHFFETAVGEDAMSWRFRDDFEQQLDAWEAVGIRTTSTRGRIPSLDEVLDANDSWRGASALMD